MFRELACFVSSGASAGLGLGNERTEYLPFLIREVGGVWSSGRHNAAAPSRYGSHILRALTPSQTPSEKFHIAPVQFPWASGTQICC